MSLTIWILLLFGFAIYLRSSAKLCMRRYINGEWIWKGDCGGPGRMSEMQKELQIKIKDKTKRCIAGEGWTIFQRRVNGDIDFYRGWDEYRKGFGKCEGNWWLGLEELHERTKQGNMELEINMITNNTGIHLMAKYSSFQIGAASDKYRLAVSGYSGNATDSFEHSHGGKQFSTKDADNDLNPNQSCANRWKGAWWYNNCRDVYSNLNGVYGETEVHGVSWFDRDRDAWTYMKFVEMKFRPK